MGSHALATATGSPGSHRFQHTGVPLQVRYQGVDWRDKSNWGCNFERNPYGHHYIDGGSLEVMEVMFVKVKQRLLDQQWSYPINAQLFDEWYQAAEEVRGRSLFRVVTPETKLANCRVVIGLRAVCAPYFIVLKHVSRIV